MRPNNHLRDVLIVCTRNRPSDVDRCLRSVASSTRPPDRILIVDSSDSDATMRLVEELPLPIDYLHSERGLTHQRNVGLRAARGDIVHFIDDDVEIEPGYFAALIAAFRENPQLVGAGGIVLGATPGRPSLESRIGGRNSLKPGIVLPTGFNVGSYSTDQEIAVEWLPGCSMSFRMSAISDLEFDERRIGYATGEDVDFGLKASAVGMLKHVPAARLIHHQSPTNRADVTKVVRSAVHNRWRLAQDRLGRVNKPMVVYGTVSLALSLGIRGILGRVADERRVRRSSAAAALGGLVDVLLRGTHVDA